MLSFSFQEEKGWGGGPKMETLYLIGNVTVINGFEGLVTMQTRAPKNYCSCRLGAEQECRVCTDTGARTPIGVSGNFFRIITLTIFFVEGLYIAS